MISIITTSPMEAEQYALNSKINNAIDEVGAMIVDLTTDQNIDLQILLTVNDPDQPEEFGLALGGSTLSLEFTKDAINVTDFNPDTGDETVLESFGPEEMSKATLCLYNRVV